MRIEIVIDTVCPWCFVGKRRLERALRARPMAGVELGWRAFQLNPHIGPGGMDRRKYLAEKFGGAERARQRHRPIEEAGREEGIGFRFDLVQRTPNTLESHRLIRFAGARGRQTETVEALFAAYFTAGRDIGETAVLAEVAAGAGLDRDDVLAYLASGADAEAVVAEDERARAMGIGGVPCYIVDGKYAVSGAQTPEVFFQIFDLARQDAAGLAAE